MFDLIQNYTHTTFMATILSPTLPVTLQKYCTHLLMCTAQFTNNNVIITHFHFFSSLPLPHFSIPLIVLLPHLMNSQFNNLTIQVYWPLLACPCCYWFSPHLCSWSFAYPQHAHSPPCLSHCLCICCRLVVVQCLLYIDLSFTNSASHPGIYP